MLDRSNRYLGWWDFALRVGEGLTQPKADTAACDRAVEQLARASWLGSLLHRASWTVRSAWPGSFAQTGVSWIARELAPGPPAASIRVAGWMSAVAGTTALGLDAVKPIPLGPLSWMLPAAVVAAGLFLVSAAAPLARALDDRRLRHKVS